MPAEETGIPCWMCGLRSGVDCPGRAEDEPTLCDPCLHIHWQKQVLDQDEHLLNMLNEGELTLEQFWSFASERKYFYD